MKKAINFIKDNKTIIIIAALILALIGAIWLMNNASEKTGLPTANISADKSPQEIKLSQILRSIEGVGETDVLINEGENGIEGVVIVCSGADNIMVKNDILNAVSTALNVDKKIIAIYAMKN